MRNVPNCNFEIFLFLIKSDLLASPPPVNNFLLPPEVLRFYDFTLNFRMSKNYKNYVEKEIYDFSAPVRLSEKLVH